MKNTSKIIEEAGDLILLVFSSTLLLVIVLGSVCNIIDRIINDPYNYFPF